MKTLKEEPCCPDFQKWLEEGLIVRRKDGKYVRVFRVQDPGQRELERAVYSELDRCPACNARVGR